MVTFADISHHQGAVNLAAYKAAGYDRIVIKGTGGALDGSLRYVDPMFATWWRQAAQVGLHRVVYHFARNNNAGADEFTWCWSQIQAAGGMRPGDILCYDQEDNRPGMTVLGAQRAREFTAAAVRAGVTTGWIYSGKWYLDPAGLGSGQLPAGWRTLWISDYTVGQADTAIEVPTGWARAQFVARQYTDAATMPGIPGPCDASRVLREWLNQEADVTADEVWNYALPVPKGSEDLFALPSYPAQDWLRGPNIRAALLAKQVTALSATVNTLAGLIGAGDNDLTAEAVKAAVVAALAESEVHVDISVAGHPVSPPAGPSL